MISSVTVEHTDRANLIRVSGDLAYDTVEEVGAAFDELLAVNTDPIVLDMTQLVFIDSKGARCLLGMKEALDGRRFALAGIPPPIRNVLMRLSLAEQFRTFNAVEDALKKV